MRPASIGEAHPVVLRQFEAAARVRIGHDLSAWHSIGIELVVPGRIERIGPVDPLTVTANLDHLRTACKHLAAWVGRTASDATEMDRARKLWLSRVGNVVLAHLTGSPAG